MAEAESRADSNAARKRRTFRRTDQRIDSKGVVYNVPTDVRFWARVDIAASGCWLWTGMPNEKGYGRFPMTKKRIVMAHQFLWLRDYGCLPTGKIVMHRCDVPLCVNPQHHRFGTKAENNADMCAKGRCTHANHTGASRG